MLEYTCLWCIFAAIRLQHLQYTTTHCNTAATHSKRVLGHGADIQRTTPQHIKLTATHYNTAATHRNRILGHGADRQRTTPQHIKRSIYPRALHDAPQITRPLQSQKVVGWRQRFWLEGIARTQITNSIRHGYCTTAQGLLDWFEVDLSARPASSFREGVVYLNATTSMSHELECPTAFHWKTGRCYTYCNHKLLHTL